jgi:hypothetical protein
MTKRKLMKKLRALWRRILYTDASTYLKDKRDTQGCIRAGEREQNWYGDPWGKKERDFKAN